MSQENGGEAVCVCQPRPEATGDTMEEVLNRVDSCGADVGLEC